MGLCSGDAVCIDSLLELKVSIDTDKSLSHGRFCTDFNKLLVLLGLGTFLIESGRLESKLPGAIDPRVLLVTIVVRSIIYFNNLKMRVFAMFLKSGDPFFVLLLKVEEVLQVDGTLLTLLELPCDILRPRIRMPLLQVLFTQCSVRVVVRAEKVDSLV